MQTRRLDAATLGTHVGRASSGRRALIVAAAAAITITAFAGAGRAATTTTSLATATPRGTDWPHPGGDLANTRTAAGATLTIANAATLAPAWQVRTQGSLNTAVVVVGGTAYIQDSRCVVRAIDVATGATTWQSQPVGFVIGPQGVAVDAGMVFATTPDGVMALDQTTGAQLWKKTLTRTPTEGVDAQPVVADGLVLIATVPVSPRVQYAGGDRGVLFALDAATGDVVWSFDTVASDDLWGNPQVNSGGGAWYPPAVDTRSGTVYWGVANPAPFPGTPEFPNGSSRPGRNLYTESTVALSLKTGKLRWFRQAVEHDLFDQDFVHALIVGGSGSDRTRAVVVGAGKGGQVLGMDPKTGKLRWKTEVGVHENHDLTELSGPTTVLPGTYGGVITPPAAADGTVYVATLNAPATLEPDKTAYFGGSINTMDGQVVAIDARTGKHLWDTAVPGDPMGGATVVNDLVVTGTYQGKLVFLDRRTGTIVTTVDVGRPIAGWPAAVGDLLLVPTGTIGAPGQLFAYRVAP